ncbi:YibE/F family protein [Beutenbergia cavernae DSM 12333]|uniref:YibE/F family protein n=1 Tax=Beutenbergia cavernae (strain ATCC BAA-8 / DSM 12333 / CCUG 43141 / JCM 11478 / NBRC 16432 / NCIMB 13614 / HKI 0122) TaxID=471853 RepID=C5C4Q5_BEUC1|nr:YibE/F family protein [Beutenbergia cavernae]ACQ80033.1 YibE/F family protein [Beutenbergia cavernae DSM 12333]
MAKHSEPGGPADDADGVVAHEHGAITLPDAEARRARTVLLACVLPLLVATVAGLLALWPRGDTPIGSIPLGAPGVTFDEAVVLEGTQGADTEVLVRLETGQGAGQSVPIQVPPEVAREGVDAGARIRVIFVPEALGTGVPYVFVDFDRDVPIGILVGIYAAVVLLVARWRGLAAMAGLGMSLAVVGFFVVPALMLGTSPLLVALVGSSAMMFVSLYLAHGVSIRTTTALLGTFGGLAVTTALAAWSTGAARLVGTGSEDQVMLAGTFPDLSLSALLVCGIVIAGLGALNDVTITQASAVWEIHAADPTASRRRVFSRAMRIGRDHIASTVYTLAFAYVGTALPLIMLASLYDRTLLGTLTTGEIVEEVVRTLVSSIGLVLAIPATTGIAALLVRSSRARGERESDPSARVRPSGGSDSSAGV